MIRFQKFEESMKSNKMFRLAANAMIAIGIAGWVSTTTLAADTGVKGNPPYVWAHVKDKADADAVKPGDSIAMVCAKCKTISVMLVTQDTKTKTKLVPGEKHLCAGCKSTITVVGSKANNTTVIKHVCAACGDDSAFCCATKPGAASTKGMEKN